MPVRAIHGSLRFLCFCLIWRGTWQKIDTIRFSGGAETVEFVYVPTGCEHLY